MAKMLNHVGRLKKTQRKVVVAYKTVPGESDNCILITTENLMGDEHDSLMKLLESNAGQNAFEFAEAMSRTTLPNGENMLYGFHRAGRMIKMPTNEVEMVPERNTVINLNDLNEQIAQQKGVTVEDLALGDSESKNSQNQQVNESQEATPEPEVSQTTSEPTGDVLTDEQLAAKYRSQADSMFKEAKRLQDEARKLKEEAETLNPKKQAKSEEEENKE